MRNSIKNKKTSVVPGTIIECNSGRFVAYYEHRTDIIASGENERQAKKNLKEMYASVIEYEEESEKKTSIVLPDNFKTHTFKEKIPVS
jgi:predicted RNase H-like HicB family nuclease